MARINIEDCWWTDPRRSRLIKLVGGEELADGLAVKMWRLAQEFWGRGDLVPIDVFESLEASAKLIEAKLAELRDDGIYVRGSSQYLDWVRERRLAAAQGGKKSGETRRKKSDPATKKQIVTRSKRKQSEPSGSISVSDSVSDSDSPSIHTSYEQKARAFVAGYCSRFKARWNTNPEIGGKEAGIASRLAKNLSLDKIDLYLDAFFAMPDANLNRDKHPLALFELKLNQIVVFANTGSFMTQKQAQQADNAISNLVLLQQVREGKV